MIQPQWKPEFESRLRRQADDLKWLFCEIYHNDLSAYDDLIAMLYRQWQARPEDLKTLDRQREDEPRWYRDRGLVGMRLDVAAFAGTLKGLQGKLDYLAECGVSFLYLMPLLETAGEPGRSAVSDYGKVQPALGAMKDLARLAQKCHQKGMSLGLDFVLNHTSDRHEWARRAKAGEKEYQDRYFFYDSWELPNAYEQTMPQELPLAAPGNFTWCQEAGKAVMTTFYPDQWDLNYMNPVVFREMAEAMLHLCNQGIDIIRLDAVPFIWKALGTSCRNLRQVHTLVRMLRMVSEIVCPAVLLLGDATADYFQGMAYFGTAEKPECHLMDQAATMAAVWHTVATRDARLLGHHVERLFSLPREFTFLQYLRSQDDVDWQLDFGYLGQFGTQENSHKRYLNDYLSGKWPGSTARGELSNDDPRLNSARLCGRTASLCGLEAARASGDTAALARAVRLDILLHALLFTLSGVPVLCSGDEIGQENDPDYRLDPARKEDRRNLHRGKMDWKKAALRADLNTPEGQLFSAVSRLQALRSQYSAFDCDARSCVLNPGNDHILAIGRSGRGEQILALFNFSSDAQIAWIKDLSLYTDLFTGATIDAGAVTVQGYGFRWLLHKEDA